MILSGKVISDVWLSIIDPDSNFRISMIIDANDSKTFTIFEYRFSSVRIGE